ncbi:MAG TPA: nucleoside monophosphate kinase [Leptolyngbyaceae cyanobacterium]
MRLVILGGAGAGKGTQARLLSTHLNVPAISTGDILRSAIATSTDLGLQAQPYVDKGELVPDPTMIEFMRLRLLLFDVVDGWVLDGYPRTAFQAEELDFLLDDLKQHLDWAIWLDVPESILISRSLDRSRDDDVPEIIQRRIQLFQERTALILDYYERRQRLLTIDGNQSAEKVQQDILQKIM